MSSEEVPVVEVPVVEEVEMAPMEEEQIEKAKIPEAKKDAEADEVENNDVRFSDEMKLNPDDGTLNVMVTGGNIISGLNIDHMQLCAAGRLNVGVTHGRYLFEAEMMQLGGNNNTNAEARVGFSLANSSKFLGDKGTMSFSSNGTFSLDGTPAAFKTRRLVKGDVVGLLINRTEEGNARTISAFVNGQRVGEPLAIPESFDGALFPHVLVKGAIVSVNLTKNVMKELPFKCRTIGDASKDHIVPTCVKEVEETSVMVPLGFKTDEWVESYIIENPMENIVVISDSFWNEWQDKSNSGKRQRLSGDLLLAIFKLMNLRKRKFIFTIGHNFLSEGRKKFLANFGNVVKTIAVFPEGTFEDIPTNTTFYKDVTVPTQEEGWTEIKFSTTVKEAEESIKKWQKRCKNCTKVEDLEASDKLKEKITKWDKFVEATKKEAEKNKKAREIALKLANGEEVKEEEEKKEDKKEEKKEGDEKEEVVDPSAVDTVDFTEEDWMLATLRMELHTLCHAFRKDVTDKERIGFSPEFLAHYYKLYAPAGRTLLPQTYGCKKESELIELIKETIQLEDNLLIPLQAADASFDELVQKTEEARQERVDRIGAGDEGAKLKFKARMPIAKGMKGNPNAFARGNFAKGASKGGKGPAIVQKPIPQQIYVNKGGAKGGSYPMRTIPGAASGMKRPQVSNVQSAPKRRF